MYWPAAGARTACHLFAVARPGREMGGDDVQGNCVDDMPSPAELSLDTAGPDLWPQKPGQCLLSGFNGQAMYVGAPEGFPIWLDNIYLRQGDGATQTGFIIDISRWSETAPIAAATSAWVTNITIQGNAESVVFGMSVDSRTYVEGVYRTNNEKEENGRCVTT